MFEKLFKRKNESMTAPQRMEIWIEKKIKELEYLEQDERGRLTPYGIAHHDLKARMIREAKLAVDRGEVESIEKWIRGENERIEARKGQRNSG